MIGELTLENFMIPRSLESNYSSNSSIGEIDKIAEDIIEDKFEIIESYIGKELFKQLSYSDKIFMSETAGSINFGHPIDLNQIAKDIKRYDDY